jgi:K+ transporter
MDFIANAEQLGKLGVVTILLAIVIAMAWFIYKDDQYKKEMAEKDKEKTDILIDLVSELKQEFKSQHLFLKEQTDFMKNFMDSHIEHYRLANSKCKDDISIKLDRTMAELAEIKTSIQIIRASSANC